MNMWNRLAGLYMPEQPANNGRYKEMLPSEPLRPYVQALWMATLANTVDEYRVIPDGCTDLIFQVTTSRIRAIVVGPTDTFEYLTVAEPAVFLGARFYPGVAPLLFRQSIESLKNQTVEAAQVFGSEIKLLTEVKDIGFGAIEHLLEGRLSLNHGVDADLAEVLHKLYTSNEKRDVEELAREQYMSSRSFNRLFNSHLGMGPKTFMRIVRFQRTLQALKSGEQLAHTAQRMGFSDEPHLVHEFKRLYGATPGLVAQTSILG